MFWQIGQAQSVCDVAPALADDTRNVAMRIPVVGAELGVARGLLESVEIRALHVFHDGDLERLAVASLDDDDGDIVEPRALRRPPAPLASNDFVSIRDAADRLRPGDDRLIQTFVTPTLIHLSVVFMIALLVLSPEGKSLTPTFGLIGVVGLVYSSRIALKVARMLPVDWAARLFHGGIPFISYAGIVAAAARPLGMRLTPWRFKHR